MTPLGPEREGLTREIARVLNCACAENVSNTPDFILAQFLEGCLAAFNTATQQRENWYGRDPRPSAMPLDAPQPMNNAAAQEARGVTDKGSVQYGDGSPDAAAPIAAPPRAHRDEKLGQNAARLQSMETIHSNQEIKLTT